MPPSPAELLASPDHFLFAFDADEAEFARMDRGAYARSIFLDQRIAALGPGRQSVPLAALRAEAEVRAEPIGWIFHVAHCGSTLLARALDREADDLVLREPGVLRQLGIEAVASAGSTSWGERLDLALRLLGRRYRPCAPVIVKANVPVNFIAARILESQPDAPAILLHHGLYDYLLAILRSDDHRGWLRRVSDALRPAIEAETGPFGTEDFERAAALWLAQIRIFAGLVDRYPRAHSLLAEQLFASPAEVLRAAYALFGIAVSAAEIDAIVAGPIFATHAKSPERAFGNAERVQRKTGTAIALRGELALARSWVERRCEGAASFAPGRPLLPPER